MRLSAALVALAVLGSTTPASADGLYGTYSFGAGHITDELGDLSGSASFRLRLAGGYRFERLAIEAWIAPEFIIRPYEDDNYPTRAERSTTGGDPYGTTDTGVFGTYGVDIKLLQPLSTHWSAYARGSMS